MLGTCDVLSLPVKGGLSLWWMVLVVVVTRWHAGEGGISAGVGAGAVGPVSVAAVRLAVRGACQVIRARSLP